MVWLAEKLAKNDENGMHSSEKYIFAFLQELDGTLPLDEVFGEDFHGKDVVEYENDQES